MSTIKADNYEGANPGNNMVFKTNSTERMRIDTSGNVGIGTNTPLCLLDIQGTDSNYLNAVRVYNGSGAAYLSLVPTGTSNSVVGWTSNSVVIEGVPQSSGNTILGSYTNNLVFQTNNRNERMRIDSNGKVGIGTASPAVALDVVGEARSSTSTTSGSNSKTLTTKDYVDSVAADKTLTFGGVNYGIGTILVYEGFALGNSAAVTIGATVTPYMNTGNGHIGGSSYGTALSGTWKILCGFNDDSGNQSTKLLIIRTA